MSVLSSRPLAIPHDPLLYASDSLDQLIPRRATPAHERLSAAPFMDALRGVGNRVLTANSAAAFRSTGDATLDAFTGLSQATAPEDYASLLAASWDKDPLTTIKVIWNLRSIHQGKAAREPFYRAFAWLYEHHPRSAIANLPQLVAPCIPKPAPKSDAEKDTVVEARLLCHGYFKDLLNILVLAATNQLSTTSKFTTLHAPRVQSKQPPKRPTSRQHNRRHPHPSGLDSQSRVEASKQKDAVNAKLAHESRRQTIKQNHESLLTKLKHDIAFRALYIAVARFFARQLAVDVTLLRERIDDKTTSETEISRKLSLAGKWAPSVGGSHDRITNICTAIALIMCREAGLETLQIPFPLVDSQIDASQAASQEFAQKLCASYTRCVISPLRRIIDVPELHMSANEWHKVVYPRVPSVCMSNSKTLFFSHDPSRFTQYLRDVATGKKTISGATLLPHQLLFEAVKPDHHPTRRDAKETEVEKLMEEVKIKVLEEQWRALARSVRETGALDNAIAICDVSGSMGYLGSSVNSPIHPAVALSILLAQSAKPPWQNCFITFSAEPEIVTLDANEGLATIARRMGSASWGMNTDFNAIFTKLILPLAISNQLKKEDMIKRLFVFSDMEFNNSRGMNSYNTASLDNWETEHSIIKNKFETAGYEIPEIVYWNLQGRGPHATTKDEPGVAMVSGFSPSMLKVFLEQGAVEDTEQWQEVDEHGKVHAITQKLDPIETMHKALGGEGYQGLKLYDWHLYLQRWVKLDSIITIVSRSFIYIRAVTVMTSLSTKTIVVPPPPNLLNIPALVLQITTLTGSVMIWAGATEHVEESTHQGSVAPGRLAYDWACAMPSRSEPEKSPATGTSLFRPADGGSALGMALRLASRLKQQVLLSLDLRTMSMTSPDPLVVAYAEKKIIEAMEGR